MTTTIEIATVLPWGPSKRVETKLGPRDVREAAPTEAFWAAWWGAKEALKAAGIAVSQYQGAWKVTWWQQVDPAERSARELALEVSRATDADVEIPRPDGCEYRGYQRAGVAFGRQAFARGTGVLIADEPGLGKTIQAIGLINSDESIRKVLIVCPNTIKQNWARELRKWLTRPMRIGVQKADVPWLGNVSDVVIVNYDIAHRFEQIASTVWDMRITDESHWIKNPKSRRTKAVLQTRARCKVALTGTPIENRPVELWPIISDLDPRSWDPKKGFFRFAKKFCGAEHNGYGWNFGGHSEEEELQRRLRSTIMVRRLKSQVLTELPAKSRQVIELDLNGRVSKLSDEAAAAGEQIEVLRAAVELAKASELRADYEAAVQALEDGQGAAFAAMAKMRHDIGMAKVDQVIEYVSDARENGKVLIFGHHLDVVHALKAAFPQAAVITGETPADARMAEVDRFQTDPACDVFIGNNAAAEGITLTAGTHVVFAEGDWVPGKLAQKEDRAHRIGQKNAVLVTYLVAGGTLDATMIKTCVEKMDVIDMILDKPIGESASAQAECVAGRSAARPITFESIERAAVSISPEACAIALTGMRVLAGVCDGAVKRDDCGFSGVDVRIGHSFAGQARLTPKQGALASRLCRKYKRQLGPDFIARLLAACGGKIP